MSSRDCIRVKISLVRVKKGGISGDAPQICSFHSFRVEQQEIVKFPAHRAGLPGKERTRQDCAPLTPPTRRGLRDAPPVTSVFISIFAYLRHDAPSWHACAASNSKSLFVERIVNIMSGFAAPYMLKCAKRHDSSGRRRAWVETLRLRGRQGVSSRSARSPCQNLCLTKACRRRLPASAPLRFQARLRPALAHRARRKKRMNDFPFKTSYWFDSQIATSPSLSGAKFSDGRT